MFVVSFTIFFVPDEDVRKYLESLRRTPEPPVQVREVDSSDPRPSTDGFGFTLEDEEGQNLYIALLTHKNTNKTAPTCVMRSEEKGISCVVRVSETNQRQSVLEVRQGRAAFLLIQDSVIVKHVTQKQFEALYLFLFVLSLCSLIYTIMSE